MKKFNRRAPKIDGHFIVKQMGRGEIAHGAPNIDDRSAAGANRSVHTFWQDEAKLLHRPQTEDICCGGRHVAQIAERIAVSIEGNVRTFWDESAHATSMVPVAMRVGHTQNRFGGPGPQRLKCQFGFFHPHACIEDENPIIALNHHNVRHRVAIGDGDLLRHVDQPRWLEH